MCGIIGQVNKNATIISSDFERMRDTLAHRGSDGFGAWYSEDKKTAFGHRRLSLIDLSEKGKQPMCNEDRTLWLTCNGEIYNYNALKNELIQKGHVFCSESDSEVIIHGYEEWGASVLEKLDGMFAFGIYDEKNQKLFLARDRFGIKPLYYYYDSETLIFASEIKAIIASSMVPRKINFTSFCNFFTYRYIPSPDTIWENINKLSPATYLIFDKINAPIVKEYYSPDFITTTNNYENITAKLDNLLEQSVSSHILSDVQVGFFLSGGYDSSTIAYYLNKIKYNTQAFSIGFENWEKSEHYYAALVAKTFQQPLQTTIMGNDNLSELEDLSYFYDEPLADISILPTYFVSKSAASKVKAVLSGEGADEIFAGYTWHREIPLNLDIRSKIYYLTQKIKRKHAHFSVENYSEAMSMGCFDKKELCKLLNPDLFSYIPEDTNWFYRKHFKKELSGLKAFQYLDIKTFMGELVLTKVDRASMANSLEVRVPFLNHHLTDFVTQLPEEKYFSKSQTKILLQNTIKNKIPQEIIKRPKQGFVGPDTYYMDISWYKKNLENCNLIREKIIRKETVEGYLQSKDHWRLWKILIMENWYKKWMI
ncbi:MAG: asparagine synthase (glutamine-hydrolyzing) [Bacteroidetes bacterium RIFOXYA12_FULL_35_11]|nr:MAG: asparagine synthase (glutamine-hydrolyzing) [Bacteroidetes bacterium GWF2_35_48]OFY80402.1 MAG: asparagine synthase (glutamine-hydrolyzing) [Bacteroidetes bacterium RIFOXYA12_FULL_35_11]OFY96647.1 MAG: asparagine synthase (glutamine-hydrolyzing) [Bacteroidetes bacterium RIFOXYB2_FULL_35_7]OFZ05670.1 MAG: asparagine synthase (glutamine-hydrolyzing) [Bacteroidetes bacterium RIFOXYC12_FULL_35_7]HBX51867.1 asparagine synthase (glutamine-hydrolyzing) [Bacteroidales bacterium]